MVWDERARVRLPACREYEDNGDEKKKKKRKRVEWLKSMDWCNLDVSKSSALSGHTSSLLMPKGHKSKVSFPLTSWSPVPPSFPDFLPKVRSQGTFQWCIQIHYDCLLLWAYGFSRTSAITSSRYVILQVWGLPFTFTLRWVGLAPPVWTWTVLSFLVMCSALFPSWYINSP